MSSAATDSASLSSALGCLLGAFVGDSAGSLLEFQNAPSAADVDRAMEMPGGGVHRVLPGQVTDDGELTLSLAHALLEANSVADNAPFNGFPASIVARWYGRWMQSDPFDAGNTCRTAMYRAVGATAADDATHKYADMCMQTALEHSSLSKANGSLMRCTPIAICYHRATDDIIASHATADAKLSHPNLTCCMCEALYCIAIAHLIRSPHDRHGACQRVEQYWTQWKTTLFAEIDQEEETEQTTSQGKQLKKNNKQSIIEVNDWLYIARTGNGLSPVAYDNQGFIKHAFIYAFYHLYHNTDYTNALRHVLLAGGDTDTNACIVGGLIGAAVGADGIPAEMRRKVMECKSDHDFTPATSYHQLSTVRPEWLWPNQAQDIATKLYYKHATQATE